MVMTTSSFEGLTAHRIVRDGVILAAWSGGSGPPVLLLHGYPQSSYMWRHVIPALLPDHRVIAMDLRGYGSSDAPAPDTGNELYSKREMTKDAAYVLDELGVESAHLVGHDRGARVVHRFCLDNSERVRTAAVFDIIPTLVMYESADRSMAESYFHWFFLTRRGGMPEAMLRSAPNAWIESRFAGRHRPGFEFGEAAISRYKAAFRRPGVIEATCSDYRAAATVDLDHDRADRAAGRRVAAPMLVGWGRHGYVGTNFDVPTVWSSYAERIRPMPLEADHYVAEENPEQVVSALTSFWAEQ